LAAEAFLVARFVGASAAGKVSVLPALHWGHSLLKFFVSVFAPRFSNPAPKTKDPVGGRQLRQSVQFFFQHDIMRLVSGSAALQAGEMPQTQEK
ncbi:MAG: hypothetical protein ACOYVI_10150, partial [Bacillota bacterium]